MGKARKRKKKRWSTYRGLTGRRSWTLTSLSLTRIPAVEVEEDVVVDAAVDVVEKVLTSTPSGRKPPSTRRKTKSKARKRKKKRWSTYRGLTGRRSWTLTSLSLTRIPAVVVDAAVDVVEKVESIASAAKDQKASVVNVLNVARGQKVIVHPDRKEREVDVEERGNMKGSLE